jgi:Fe-S oxidoreductase
VSAPAFSYADYFGQISLLGDLLLDGAERPWLTSIPEQPDRKQYVVWLGCNVLRTVHIVETLNDILRHIGLDYVMLGGPANCCGVQHARRGEAETGRKLAWNTFGKFDAFQPERLLFWCPSCDHRLNGMGDDLSELAAQRQHVTEFFVEHLDRFQFKPLPGLRVALHAHTGTPQQDLDARATRRLLEAIPGVEVVDVPAVAELGFHCADPKIAQFPKGQFGQILADSVAAAQAHRVDTLVTIYHACHRELVPADAGDDVIAPGIRVENYVSILARALGLPEHTDRFKHFAQLGDPAAILAELEPRIEQLGVSRERIERVVSAQFGTPSALAAAIY